MTPLTSEQTEAFHAAGSHRPDLQPFRALLDKDPTFALLRWQGWRTPLYDTAGAGDLKLAQRLLDLGCPLEPKEDGQLTPLHCATLSGQKDLAEFLLDRGAGVDRRDQNKLTPLHHLVCRSPWFGGKKVSADDLHFVRMLLERGADPNARPPARAVGYDGTCLEMALMRQNYDLVELLLAFGAQGQLYRLDLPLVAALLYRHEELRRGEEPPEGCSSLLRDAYDYPKGHSPIHRSIVESDVRALHQGLQEGWDIATPNRNGRTPLHLAALLGEEAAVRLLLERGADALSCAPGLEMPSELARSAGREQIWRLLDHGEDLLKAAANDELETLLYALDRHPALVHWTSVEHDCTLLHLACSKGATRVARLLLDRGANVNQQNHQGSSALHFVWDNLELAKLLLERGADLKLPDKNGNTPVHSSSGQARAFLLSRGAKPSCVRKMLGEMLSHAISQSGYLQGWQESASSVCFSFSAVQLLLRKGSVLKLRLDGVKERPQKSFPTSCWLRRGVLRLSLDPMVTLELDSFGGYTAERLVLEDGAGEFALEAVEARHMGWVEAWKSGELGDDAAGLLSIPLG